MKYKCTRDFQLWNDKLAKSAQDYINKCKMGHDGNEERKTAAGKWISTTPWLRELQCVHNVVAMVMHCAFDMISDKLRYYIYKSY